MQLRLAAGGGSEMEAVGVQGAEDDMVRLYVRHHEQVLIWYIDILDQGHFKAKREGQDKYIPSWQKETRLVAGVKKHPVILNATAQMDTRHFYQGQLADAITAID
ncbi:hypothetical protein DUI87_18223 [Hirundo rustica rustica]|uniref:Uncharacterized protein n=1 Tax=Hirundo rustica rustica TaxID=333673 RepID=A0A3M0JVJ2_HIRRU|nr:hypothetical protein DUI87_18223 [Hirundo rustica rustica]